MEMDLASLQSVREFAEQYKGPIACILVRCFIFLVAVQQLDAVQVKVSQTNGMNNWNWTSDLCFKWCVLSCFNQHWKKGPQSSPQIGSDLKEKSELSGCACAQRCYSGHWRPDPNRGPWIFSRRNSSSTYLGSWNFKHFFGTFTLIYLGNDPIWRGILRKPAGRLGVVSPCERSENKEGVWGRGVVDTGAFFGRNRRCLGWRFWVSGSRLYH